MRGTLLENECLKKYGKVVGKGKLVSTLQSSVGQILSYTWCPLDSTPEQR